MVAAALEVSEYLKEDFDDFEEEAEEFPSSPPPPSSKNWQNRLNETLSLVPRRAASSNPAHYVAVAILERSRLGMYGYGEHEFAATKSEETIAVQTVPDSWDLVRIHRQREQYFYQLLTDPVYRLKRADSRQPFGTFELRARAHPFDSVFKPLP